MAPRSVRLSLLPTSPESHSTDLLCLKKKSKEKEEDKSDEGAAVKKKSRPFLTLSNDVMLLHGGRNAVPRHQRRPRKHPKYHPNISHLAPKDSDDTGLQGIVAAQSAYLGEAGPFPHPVGKHPLPATPTSLFSPSVTVFSASSQTE